MQYKKPSSANRKLPYLASSLLVFVAFSVGYIATESSFLKTQIIPPEQGNALPDTVTNLDSCHALNLEPEIVLSVDAMLAAIESQPEPTLEEQAAANPVLENQSFNVDATTDLTNPDTQKQLLQTVKDTYGKEDWNLSSLALDLTNSLFPPSPEDQTLLDSPFDPTILTFQQTATLKNSVESVPVEDAKVSLIVKDSALQDDSLVDGYATNIIPQEPTITKTDAPSKIEDYDPALYIEDTQLVYYPIPTELPAPTTEDPAATTNSPYSLVYKVTLIAKDTASQSCPTIPECVAPQIPTDTNVDGCMDTCQAPDSDQDGIPDDKDNCPAISSPDQHDSDQDGLGDECDNCPDISNPDQEDGGEYGIYLNGIGDVCEDMFTVKVSPSSATIFMDQPYNFEAVPQRGYCNDEEGFPCIQTIIWSLDTTDNSVATIDANTGTVTPVSTGMVTVRATSTKDPTKSDTATLTIVDTCHPAAKITVTPARISLDVNESHPLEVSVEGCKDHTVTWASSDESVATVDATGTVTTIAPGDAIITASSTLEPIRSTAMVHVMSSDAAPSLNGTVFYIDAATGEVLFTQKSSDWKQSVAGWNYTIVPPPGDLPVEGGSNGQNGVLFHVNLPHYVQNPIDDCSLQTKIGYGLCQKKTEQQCDPIPVGGTTPLPFSTQSLFSGYDPTHPEKGIVEGEVPYFAPPGKNAPTSFSTNTTEIVSSTRPNYSFLSSTLRQYPPFVTKQACPESSRSSLISTNRYDLALSNALYHLGAAVEDVDNTKSFSVRNELVASFINMYNRRYVSEKNEQKFAYYPYILEGAPAPAYWYYPQYNLTPVLPELYSALKIPSPKLRVHVYRTISEIKQTCGKGALSCTKMSENSDTPHDVYLDQFSALDTEVMYHELAHLFVKQVSPILSESKLFEARAIDEGMGYFFGVVSTLQDNRMNCRIGSCPVNHASSNPTDSWDCYVNGFNYSSPTRRPDYSCTLGTATYYGADKYADYSAPYHRQSPVDIEDLYNFDMAYQEKQLAYTPFQTNPDVNKEGAKMAAVLVKFDEYLRNKTKPTQSELDAYVRAVNDGTDTKNLDDQFNASRVFYYPAIAKAIKQISEDVTEAVIKHEDGTTEPDQYYPLIPRFYALVYQNLQGAAEKAWLDSSGNKSDARYTLHVMLKEAAEKFADIIYNDAKAGLVVGNSHWNPAHNVISWSGVCVPNIVKPLQTLTLQLFSLDSFINGITIEFLDAENGRVLESHDLIPAQLEIGKPFKFQEIITTDFAVPANLRIILTDRMKAKSITEIKGSDTDDKIAYVSPVSAWGCLNGNMLSVSPSIQKDSLAEPVNHPLANLFKGIITEAHGSSPESFHFETVSQDPVSPYVSLNYGIVSRTVELNADPSAPPPLSPPDEITSAVKPLFQNLYQLFVQSVFAESDPEQYREYQARLQEDAKTQQLKEMVDWCAAFRATPVESQQRRIKNLDPDAVMCASTEELHDTCAWYLGPGGDEGYLPVDMPEAKEVAHMKQVKESTPNACITKKVKHGMYYFCTDPESVQKINGSLPELKGINTRKVLLESGRIPDLIFADGSMCIEPDELVAQASELLVQQILNLGYVAMGRAEANMWSRVSNSNGSLLLAVTGKGITSVAAARESDAIIRELARMRIQSIVDGLKDSAGPLRNKLDSVRRQTERLIQEAESLSQQLMDARKKGELPDKIASIVKQIEDKRVALRSAVKAADVLLEQSHIVNTVGRDPSEDLSDAAWEAVRARTVRAAVEQLPPKKRVPVVQGPATDRIKSAIQKTEPKYPLEPPAYSNDAEGQSARIFDQITLKTLRKYNSVGTIYHQLAERYGLRSMSIGDWLQNRAMYMRDYSNYVWSEIIRLESVGFVVRKFHIVLPEVYGRLVGLEKVVKYLDEAGIVAKFQGWTNEYYREGVISPLQKHKVATLYVRMESDFQKIVSVGRRLAKEGVFGIPLKELKAAGADVSYEVPVKGTNNLLYHTVEAVITRDGWLWRKLGQYDNGQISMEDVIQIFKDGSDGIYKMGHERVPLNKAAGGPIDSELNWVEYLLNNP